MRKRTNIFLGKQKRRIACDACFLAPAAFLFLCVFSTYAQETGAEQNASEATAATVNTTRVAVRGQVRNALTGTGLARVLVRIEGDAATGALTDGDGRFEFASVPSGPQVFSLSKPGFLDSSRENTMNEGARVASISHNVVVAEDMAELAFTLSPTAVLRGSVLLASGEAAAGIKIDLVQRTIEGGRAVWQQLTQTRTRSDGSFRFGSLPAGTYTLYTEPYMQRPNDVEDGTQTSGIPALPPVYFPNAREPGGTSPVELAAGAEALVSLTLTEEIFYRVTVALNGTEENFRGATAEIQDTDGRALPYSVRYNAAQRQLKTMLPDGSYRMEITQIASSPNDWKQGIARQNIRFTVAGKDAGPFHVKLVQHAPPLIEVTLLGNGSTQGRNEQISVLANQAQGWLDGGMMSLFTNGPASGPLTVLDAPSGSSWLHAQIANQSLCEGSFTAGGVSMAREPLRIGASGSVAPLQLSVRRDCAQLTLRLPPSVMNFQTGDEPYFTAYVVPDFDFTHDPERVTLRPTSGGSFTFSALTPGSYHVYLFAGERRLEYRNPAVLAALPSQTVTLEPNGKSELVLELPQR